MATITRYRPFQPMTSLRREIDRLFGDVLPAFREEEDGDVFTGVWAPRIDFSETGSEFLIKMDLPGIEKDEVTVNVEDSQLTVSGERKKETKEENENYLRMERSYGSFFRSIPLPKAAKIDQVKAAFKNGVLTVRVPKAEESKPRKVEIS